MKQTVWVVDDEQTVLDVLEALLTKMGYRVRCFNKPEDLLNEYQLTRPDIVIADLRMPHISGVELTRQLREHDPEALVVILTGYPSVEDAVEAIQAGAVDFIAKPCRAEELEVRIQNTLDNKLLKSRLGRNRVLALALAETLPIWVILGMLAARFIR